MMRNVGQMIRFNQIQADLNAPEFVQGHTKQENIWWKQKQQKPDDAVLKTYPKPGEEIVL